MREHRLEGRSGTSSIAVGARLEELSGFAKGRRAVLVTDAQVRAAQGRRFPDLEVIQVGRGEGSKTLAAVEALYEAFLERELDRGCLVVGVGGGIVCDITGFAASTYQRGLAFGFAPTTLLAQVDASIGGKNGVNLRGYKNLVGLIRQPEFVLVDPSTLGTLPGKEIRCGLAEVVKAAAIADAGLFELLERRAEQVLALDPEALSECITRAVDVKISIVRQDEGEAGLRMLLNFGHTLGHALEAATEGALSHGEAVAVGMAAAARISVAKGLLDPPAALRLEALLARLGLPVRAEAGLLDGALAGIRQDKKRRGRLVHWVLLEALGRGAVHPMELGEAEALLREVRP